MSAKPAVTPMLLAYRLICPRKAWLSGRGLWMEQESGAVMEGRLLEASTQKRKAGQLPLSAEFEGIRLNGKVDRVDWQAGAVIEVKKGRACQEAHRWQLRAYLWMLRLVGAEGPNGAEFVGRLHYPAIKHVEAVELEGKHVRELEDMVRETSALLTQETPPSRCPRVSFCRKCAFEELCLG